MEKQVPIAYRSIFELISTEFRKAGIAHILVGGYAVNAYQVSRQTADVDFLVKKDDRQAVKVFMEENGYSLSQENDSFIRFKGKDIRFMDVDFILVEDPTLDAMMMEGKKIMIGGQEYVIPSLLHLIAMKLHSVKNNPQREFKDLGDIFELIRINKMNVRDKSFKEICCRYGNDMLFKRISDYFPA